MSHFALVPKSEKLKRNRQTNQSEKRPLLRINKTLQNTQTLRHFITQRRNPANSQEPNQIFTIVIIIASIPHSNKRKVNAESSRPSPTAVIQRVLFSHRLNSVSRQLDCVSARKQPSHIRIKVLHFPHSRLPFAECFLLPLAQDSAFFFPNTKRIMRGVLLFRPSLIFLPAVSLRSVLSAEEQLVSGQENHLSCRAWRIRLSSSDWSTSPRRRHDMRILTRSKNQSLVLPRTKKKKKINHLERQTVNRKN